MHGPVGENGYVVEGFTQMGYLYEECEKYAQFY